LPLATAYTRVRDPGWANGITGSEWPVPPRSWACRSWRCSAVIAPKSISTAVTPDTDIAAAVMSVRSLSFSGHPDTVSRDADARQPAVRHRYRRDHAEFGDRAPDLGILHGRERRRDGVLDGRCWC
jgi:hypothetical protein